ncbi:MAG: V-type ATP synthase subunit D [Candidatus Micrarchaeaceae archaeon]
MEKLNPTRINLIRTRERTKTANKGYSILKRKREALVIEFLKLLKESGKDRDQLYNILQNAYKTVALSSAFAGNFELESAAEQMQESGTVKISVKNIMGVKIPETSKMSFERSTARVLSESTAVLDVSSSFDEVLNTILDVAQREQGLKRLVLEIEKTKRRVNALDYIVIPQLKNQAKYISMRLEELDRDTFSALKHVKKKLSKVEK